MKIKAPLSEKVQLVSFFNDAIDCIRADRFLDEQKERKVFLTNKGRSVDWN